MLEEKKKYHTKRGSKYRARLLDLQGNFLGEIFAKDAIEMREKNLSEYRKYKFESTHQDPTRRREVIPVLNSSGKSFFRYKIGSWKNTGNGGEKLPHRVTKHAIATAINNLAMEEEPLCCHDNISKKDLLFWPIEAVTEVKTPFVTDEDNPNSLPFSVDVGVSFYKSEPKDLLEKYQGVIAIEVADSHYVEPDKTKCFEEHGIAIFEYKLNRKKWGLREKMNDDEIERIIDIMEEKFQNTIFGKVQSDPISIKSANKMMKEAQDEVVELKHLANVLFQEKEHVINEAKVKESQLESIISCNLDEIRSLKIENKNLININMRLRDELAVEKNKGLLQHCIDIIKQRK